MERKTLDFVCWNPGYDFVDSCYMTHSLDGCDHTWVYASILTGWLRPYHGSRLLCILLWMAATIPHISCTWAISCISLCRFSGGSCMCSCKAFHPSLSLGPHALGGICYTVICHRPCYPFPALWRTHSGTCEKWHNLKTLALCSPKYGLHIPWRHLLQNILKKSPFSISADPQCINRANGGNPPKRACQLVLCLGVIPAPTKFGKYF